VKYSNYLIGGLFFTLVLTILLTSTGCTTNTIDAIRDPDLGTGCVVVEYKLGFDSYFKTTQGGAEACKVKCSYKLPENFYYEYNNERTGCHVVVSDTELSKDYENLGDVGSLSDIKKLSDIGD